MKSALLVLIVFGTGCGFASGQEVDFTRDIRPILSDKCFHCHGNDEKTREAGLRLDERDEAIEMGAIVPGSVEDSSFWERINSDDEDEIMPPPRSHKSLSNEEKETFRKWIESGAKYEQHWSYRPIKRTEVPVRENQSPIDALIERSLRKQELVAVDEADRETLIRRLSLDLTGLPPRLDDIDRFVSNQSERAYEELVDKLLEHEAFGERMAVFWLDLVRYADTIGYHTDAMMEVSAYRDYVIDSFNANKPFDEFTIEQLAGDLLPEPTVQQKIASGYNRLLQTTAEGGAQPKEYISIYAADRVRNVSGVWMGQTMGCAQCHDHKYDPITARDFYAMSAFFADIRETAVGAQVKNLFLYTEEEKAKRESWENELAANKKYAAEFIAGSANRKKAQATWEAELLKAVQQNEPRGDKSQWQIPILSNVTATHGELKEIGDGSYLITGKASKTNDYQFQINAKGNVSAIRLEALTHSSFKAEKGYSRSNGNFVLTDFEVQLNGEKIKLASAKADYQSTTGLAGNAIDDNPESGWAVDGHRKREGRRVIMFQMAEPLNLTDESRLMVTMRHNSVFWGHNIGRFRVSIPTDDSGNNELSFNSTTSIPESTKKLVQIASDERTTEQQQQLDAAFLDRSVAMSGFLSKIDNAQKSLKSLKDNVRSMLVSDSLPKPRVTKIKNRGDWMDESGIIVEPAVPEFLPSNFGEGERRLTRLDLAKWIVEPDNPLTSRTFVNRLWNLYFGRGLTDNLDDLGGQGSPPTHPELLDWLAADFQKDWDIKRMVKAIVMTDAYRRSSVAEAEIVKSDPANLWLARQGRWRIDAEFVRDTALQLSGLMDTLQVGGRSVKPYQPAGYWQHLNFPKRKWHQDSGRKLYRKSLYTFWCRSFLHPTMLAFDAPTREECVAKRARSNIPQQALVLLNDPIFVEAARGFGTRMMMAEGDTEAKIRLGWREAVGRKPIDSEIAVLIELFDSQQKRFASSENDALALLSIGESSIEAGVDVKELAAWTQVARAILNAYETISRR